MVPPTAVITEESVELPLRRFSTGDYLAMIDAGVLRPSDKVELIHGVIVDMAPAGADHHHVLMQLIDLFGSRRKGVRMAIQGTLVIAEGEVFDPDFMLLRPKPSGYKSALPRAHDVLLIIEASNSSLRRDRQVKLPVYAQAGIAEYWIADVQREVLTVHRQPVGRVYGEVKILRGDETIAPLALPGLAMRVADVFG